ncbi:hypothetical protein L7F22_065608 [Adiantum nelumboides]|nr:hypothetical protein [Adiantum nelumboides]
MLEALATADATFLNASLTDRQSIQSFIGEEEVILLNCKFTAYHGQPPPSNYFIEWLGGFNAQTCIEASTQVYKGRSRHMIRQKVASVFATTDGLKGHLLLCFQREKQKMEACWWEGSMEEYTQTLDWLRVVFLLKILRSIQKASLSRSQQSLHDFIGIPKKSSLSRSKQLMHQIIPIPKGGGAVCLLFSSDASSTLRNVQFVFVLRQRTISAGQLTTCGCQLSLSERSFEMHMGFLVIARGAYSSLFGKFLMYKKVESQ